jgi:glycosyltransferase 2 family protein
MKYSGAIKIFVSLLMLGLVLRVVRLDELEQTFRNIPLRLALIVILGYSFSQVINSFKWWLIARSASIHASFLTAVRANFVGMFANCFGLGTIGGDVLRGVLLAAPEGKKAEGVSSVLADRALGLAVLALVGILSNLLLGYDRLSPVSLVLLVLFAGAIFAGWFIGPLVVLRFFPRNNRIRGKVEQMMAVFPRSPQMMLILVAVSVVFHLTQISLIWYIVGHLDVQTGLGSMLRTIPFVNIVSTLPISWNGLGVRENAYMYFLHPDVLRTKEQVVALGAIWLLGVTASSLIGGIVAWLSGDFRLLREEEKEEK